MFFVNIGPDSERQRENGKNQTSRRTGVGINPCFHLSPLKSTLPNRHVFIRSTALQICVISSEHFILSSVLLHHLPPFLQSWWLCNLVLQTKLKQSVVSSQFSPPHTQDLQPTRSAAQTPIFSFCPLTSPSIQTSPLQPSYNMSSRPIPLHLLQAISPTLLPALTHISPHRHLPHCAQAGSGNPTAQKTYIKHFSYRKLQTGLSPSIHSQNTRTSCLQPGLVVVVVFFFFHRTTNWMLNSQALGVAIQQTALFSVTWSPANC